jgi:hypothetical protein
MATKNKNRYGRGNLQLIPLEKVYVPHLHTDDEVSYLVLADYIILAGLLKGKRSQREHILNSIKPHESNYFHVKQFEYFLFQSIKRWLNEDLDKQITSEMVLDEIFEFFLAVWGYYPAWREVKDTVYKVSQLYYIEFAFADVDHVIEVRKNSPIKDYQPNS